MAALQERLRENADFVGREDTRKTVTEAADALDALVEALEAFTRRVPRVARSQPPETLVALAGIELELFLDADAALARVKQ